MSYSVQGAVLAPTTTGAFSSGHIRRALIFLIAIALAITVVVIEAPSATDAWAPHPSHPHHTHRTSSARVIYFAKTHLGAHFRIGWTGRRYFDCSGLVFRVYQQAGLLRKIGGSRMRAAGYYLWFRRHHRVSRSNPKPGDLIWWTKHGRIHHMGIYIGHGRALSALTTGVKKHSLHGINTKFFAFGHVGLGH